MSDDDTLKALAEDLARSDPALAAALSRGPRPAAPATRGGWFAALERRAAQRWDARKRGERR